MHAATSVAAICNPGTWRANLFSLASQSPRMIAAFSGGVKHCGGSSPTLLLKLLAIFELAQKLIELIMLRIFNDQLASAFVARLDFHASSEVRTHFFLQPQYVTVDPGRFLRVSLVGLFSLLLHQAFRFAHRKPFHHDFVGQQYLLRTFQRQPVARRP